MRKKPILIGLFAGGLILFGLSVLLAIVAVGQMHIIGGADLPTFLFVFFRAENGLYVTLAAIGMIVVLVSVGLCAVKKKG